MSSFIRFSKIPRLSKEIITITEKIDGTNGQIYIWKDDRGDLQIQAGSRNQWLDTINHNYHFYDFVMQNARELIEVLGEGRHYGEWYGYGINRGYGLKKRRFTLFNSYRWTDETK